MMKVVQERYDRRQKEGKKYVLAHFLGALLLLGVPLHRHRVQLGRAVGAPRLLLGARAHQHTGPRAELQGIHAALLLQGVVRPLRELH